jgi:Flp pilus assembly pilin Flp
MHKIINKIKKKKSSKLVRNTTGVVEVALIFGVIALVIQQWGQAVDRIG